MFVGEFECLLSLLLVWLLLLVSVGLLRALRLACLVIVTLAAAKLHQPAAKLKYRAANQLAILVLAAVSSVAY